MRNIFKIIFATMLLCATMPGWAQISLKDEETFSNQIIYLGNISGGETATFISLAVGATDARYDIHKMYCQVLGDQLIFGIAVITRNRFDDNFHLALGTDTETTIQSINDIIEWLDSSPRGNSVVFEDTDGRLIQMNHKEDDNLRFKMQEDLSLTTIVGTIELSRNNLERAIAIMEKGAYATVCKKLISDGDMNHPAVKKYLESQDEIAGNTHQKEAQLAQMNSEIAETRKKIKSLKKADPEAASELQKALSSLTVARDELSRELGKDETYTVEYD